MAKRRVSEILWLSFQYAKQDRITLIQAYDGNPKEKAVLDATRDIKDIEDLQRKLFGTVKSELESKIDKMERVELTTGNIKKILDMLV